MKNKYKRVAHFSEAKFRHIIKCFCLDLTASNTAELCGLSRNTISTLFQQIRLRIFTLAHQEAEGEKSPGVFECDESYFSFATLRVIRTMSLQGGNVMSMALNPFGVLLKDAWQSLMDSPMKCFIFTLKNHSGGGIINMIIYIKSY